LLRIVERIEAGLRALWDSVFELLEELKELVVKFFEFPESITRLVRVMHLAFVVVVDAGEVVARGVRKVIGAWVKVFIAECSDFNIEIVEFLAEVIPFL